MIGSFISQSWTQAFHSVPLVAAAGEGHEEIVERLLVAGAVINYQDKVDMNCQHDTGCCFCDCFPALINIYKTYQILKLPFSPH